MDNLYRNIRDRRLQIDMTQQELADKLGYTSKSMIAKIESGKVDISQGKIIEFAKALKTTPSDLMGWSDPQPDIVGIFYQLPDEGKKHLTRYAEFLLDEVKKNVACE